MTNMATFQPGGRFSGCSDLRGLVIQAYSIKRPSLLSGEPQWNHALFRVDAKAEGAPDVDQMRLMLQSLLEERFKLKIHRESREAATYSLVVAKGGPKLKQAKDENGNPMEKLPPREVIDQKVKENMRSFQEGKPGKSPVPGTFGYMMRITQAGGPITATMEGAALKMEKLADFLTQQVGREVVDKTGITGLYDIKLEYAPDPNMPGSPKLGPGTVTLRAGNPGGAPGPDNAPVPEFTGPIIFNAIQEQLGLKLEPDKGSIEYFVIDSAEKPSEN